MGFHDSYPLRHRCPRVAPRHHGLGRQDSNLRSRDQNPVPCHLATPHRGPPTLGCRKAARNYRDYTEASVGYQQWVFRPAVSRRLSAFGLSEVGYHNTSTLRGTGSQTATKAVRSPSAAVRASASEAKIPKTAVPVPL